MKINEEHILKMSLKYFSKIFLFQYKYGSRLLKFPNCVLNTKFSNSSHSKPAARVETKLKEFSNEKPGILNFNETKCFAGEQMRVLSYVSKNHEKYDVVKYEDMDLKEQTNFKSLELLKDFVEKWCLEEPEMNVIPEELTNFIESECSNYSLNDIFKYIILISKVRNVDSRRTLIRYLNDELIRRKRELTKKEHLKILYLSATFLKDFYLGIDFKYTRKIILHLTEKIKSLTPEQVVVFFSIVRWLSTELLKDYKFNIMISLLEYLPNFNLDEVIIVSRGFLNGNMKIKRPLAIAFANKLLEEVRNPHELPIFWVFKIISCGANFFGYNEMAAFQEKILPHAGKYKGKDLIYLARTGEKIAYVSLPLWEILANNFKKDIKNYSLTDIEKMVNMTVICNIQDEELLKMSIEEFQNAHISSLSCQSLISFVYDLIHHQIYEEKLLSLVLSKDFRLKYNIESFTTSTKRKFCFINSFIKLHRPGSNFEFLEKNTEVKLYRLFSFYPMEFGINRCYQRLLCIMLSLISIYGENFIYYSRFQPHFSKGIIMRFDKNLEAQPIPKEFKSSSGENYKRALNDDHIWLFIIVVNSYYYKQDTDIPNFEFQTQLRELEAFGYEPVLIPYHIKMLRKKSQESDDYLKDMLKNKVQEVKYKQRATI